MEAVWCVFQRLESDPCPTLAAVCASARAAEALVELSRREQEQMGEAPGEWTVQRWSVLAEDVAGLEDADRISHVLDPMRAALARPPRPAPEGEAEGGGRG